MKLLNTEKGQAAFYTRSKLLNPAQRTAFVWSDGNRPVEEILEKGAHLGLQQTDLDAMVEHGFLKLVSEQADIPVLSIESIRPTKLSDQERYLLAKPLATQLTAAMGIRGFRLNLAVEAASGAAELHALLPKIQSAVGHEKCLELERVLAGEIFSPTEAVQLASTHKPTNTTNLHTTLFAIAGT